ncbi:hypothetical protein [Accumulibacter sp.]|jgi:hypothetical protein|uniref:hypothetical protein n=1 Tax=Accumulibacter sp. TaxID=2053492 RepID=UPI001AC8B788|nr:hypothetical protein [Accumulibacter sp.]MBN8452251.1 hypothetical protein [Accumulibacter sp.]
MGRFILEIYEPGDDRTLVASLDSDAPLVVSAGEVLHTGPLTGANNRVLTVTRIEHTFWQSQEGVVHQRRLFTE